MTSEQVIVAIAAFLAVIAAGLIRSRRPSADDAGTARRPGGTAFVPAPIALQLQGATVDAFAMLFDATGRIAAMSNISRAVIR